MQKAGSSPFLIGENDCTMFIYTLSRLLSVEMPLPEMPGSPWTPQVFRARRVCLHGPPWAFCVLGLALLYPCTMHVWSIFSFSHSPYKCLLVCAYMKFSLSLECEVIYMIDLYFIMLHVVWFGICLISSKSKTQQDKIRTWL